MKAGRSDKLEPHDAPSLLFFFRRRLGFWWRQLGSITRLGVPVDRAFTVNHQDRCTLCHALGKGRTFLLAASHFAPGWYDRWNKCLASFHFSVYLGRHTRLRLSRPRGVCAWRSFAQALMSTVLPRPPGGHIHVLPPETCVAGWMSVSLPRTRLRWSESTYPGAQLNSRRTKELF